FIKDFGPPAMPDEVLEIGAKRIWHEKYLPLVKEGCAALRAPDYDKMTAAELAEHMPNAFQQAAEAFRYPTVIASPFMMPALLLTAFCERELGDDGPVLATTLLQGFANESAAAGAGLNELAAFAAQHPDLAAALRNSETEGLDRYEGGAEFLARLNQYLDVYGWRASEWCRFDLPTWVEDPREPLSLIARYLADPEHSPETAHERAVRMRTEASKTIEQRLRPESRAEFGALLESAFEHVPISEERALWQLISIGSARVPLLALGRKLVASGVIDEPGDIFFLRL